MAATRDTTAAPEAGGRTGAIYAALRIFGFVVLALMLLSIVYSGWISIENWGSIQV